jgi:hypothetical protein
MAAEEIARRVSPAAACSAELASAASVMIHQMNFGCIGFSIDEA